MESRSRKRNRECLSYSKGAIKILILGNSLALMCMFILNIFKVDLLKIAWDIELNPGPYEVIKSVQGSFNQGNISMFAETAGEQCTCNATFSISWMLIMKISCWTHEDFGHILNEGDNL